MESSLFIGIDSSELIKNNSSIDEWCKIFFQKYNMDRRKAAEPTYIITGIDYGFVRDQRIKVVIGD
jgi:hypothetical protein